MGIAVITITEYWGPKLTVRVMPMRANAYENIAARSVQYSGATPTTPRTKSGGDHTVVL